MVLGFMYVGGGAGLSRIAPDRRRQQATGNIVNILIIKLLFSYLLTYNMYESIRAIWVHYLVKGRN